MSCVLRISGDGVEVEASHLSAQPYRVGGGTAHFDVSKAGPDEFAKQIDDAIAFLRSHGDELRALMDNATASGVLDFAVEWRDVAAQYDTFPAELVREAGGLGLALELSHYPGS